MVNMTIAIPGDLHEKMKKHTEIKWSEIARRAIREYIEELDKLDKLTANSKLDEGDIDEIDHEIKKKMSKQLK
jgi:Arc/MetJ-type ribon-helix-helix transcriptional regulator